MIWGLRLPTFTSCAGHFGNPMTKFTVIIEGKRVYFRQLGIVGPDRFAFITHTNTIIFLSLKHEAGLQIMVTYELGAAGSRRSHLRITRPHLEPGRHLRVFI